MRINRLLIAGIVSIGLLASCSSESTAPESSGPATIKLTLSAGASTKTGGAGGTTTDLPSTDGSTGTSQSGEANLYRVCVGLFDVSGNVVTIKDVEAGDITYSGTTATQSNSISINTTTSASEVLVAANAPSGYFSGMTNKPGFIAQAAKLGWTTSTSDAIATPSSASVNSQQIKALPMCGSKTFTFSASIATPSVNLTRLVSRVVLNNIKTSFDPSGAYPTASFLPVEVYMYNANTQCGWNENSPASPSSYIVNTGESSTCISGGSAITSGTDLLTPTNWANSATLPADAYLSTGYVSFTGTAGTAPDMIYLGTGATTNTKPYYFYVFPNITTANSTTTVGTPLKLIIKGVWKASSSSAPLVMYYPITVNHLQIGTSITEGTNPITSSYPKDSWIEPNRVYSINNVTIKSIGVTNPSFPIDPASVNLTVSVNAWTTTSQDVTF